MAFEFHFSCHKLESFICIKNFILFEKWINLICKNQTCLYAVPTAIRFESIKSMHMTQTGSRNCTQLSATFLALNRGSFLSDKLLRSHTLRSFSLPPVATRILSPNFFNFMQETCAPAFNSVWIKTKLKIFFFLHQNVLFAYINVNKVLIIDWPNFQLATVNTCYKLVSIYKIKCFDQAVANI